MPLGSINYTAGKAGDWLRERTVAADSNIVDILRFALRGAEIGEQFCRACGLSLRHVLAEAASRKSSEDGLVQLAKTHLEAISRVCARIKTKSSRYSARSRSRKGLELLRILATVERFGDLGIVRPRQFEAPQAACYKPQPKKILNSTVHVDTPASVKLDEPNRPSGHQLPNGQDLGTVEVGGVASAEEADALFRSILVDNDASCPQAEHERLFPFHFGLNLEALRSFCARIFGEERPRDDVELKYSTTTPFWRSCEYRLLPGYDSPPEGIDCLSSSGKGAMLFPPAQWVVRQEAALDTIPADYASAVAAIKRKRQPHEGEMTFSYGVLRNVEEAILSGESVIVTGISGVGKSTLLARVRSIGSTAIFELGDGADTTLKGRYAFRYDQVPQMLKKARRLPGPKLLLADELFVEPSVLPELKMFHQIVFVGDPRQPGISGGAKHLFQFVRDLGGKSFTLPVVWRAHNPNSITLVNYLMHGSRFTICPTSHQYPDDCQFDLVESDDDARSIAAAMITYALSKINKEERSRSVMIAAENESIVKNLIFLIGKLPETPNKLQCRYLNDIQGREADVLVIDAHDVASMVPNVEKSLQFMSMMLGRARHTTCFVLGKRNLSQDRSSALPLEVIIGTILRQRVRQIEKRTFVSDTESFEALNRIVHLTFVDEETIALSVRPAHESHYFLIKDKKSHNASLLGATRCLIECPKFFMEGCNLDEECDVLVEAHKFDKVLKIGVYSWHKFEEFVEEQRKS